MCGSAMVKCWYCDRHLFCCIVFRCIGDRCFDSNDCTFHRESFFERCCSHDTFKRCQKRHCVERYRSHNCSQCYKHFSSGSRRKYTSYGRRKFDFCWKFLSLELSGNNELIVKHNNTNHINRRRGDDTVCRIIDSGRIICCLVTVMLIEMKMNLIFFHLDFFA